MKKITKMLVLALALVVSLSLGASATAEAKVNVTSVKSVDKLTGKKKITLTKGKKATLTTTVTVKPNKDKNKKVTYKSNKTSVATVNSKGVIKAKKAGTAKITVTSKKNKKKKATVTVKVVTGKVKKIKKVKADKTTLTVGEKTNVTANVKASGKNPNKTVKWTSSDTSVATVSAKGVVTAKKAGTVKIKAKSTDGTNKSASVTITVESKKATVLAPTGNDITVTVAFKAGTDLDKVQEDLNTAAKAAVNAGDDIQVTVDGTTYVATFDGTNVKVNGKLLKDSVKAQSTSKVTFKVAVKADKVATVVAFTPSYVDTVKLDDKITLSNITANSFNRDGKDTTYSYTVGADGKSIVIDGDYSGDFADINGFCVTVTVVDVQ